MPLCTSLFKQLNVYPVYQEPLVIHFCFGVYFSKRSSLPEQIQCILDCDVFQLRRERSIDLPLFLLLFNHLYKLDRFLSGF